MTTRTTTDRSPTDLALDAIPGHREIEAALAKLTAHPGPTRAGVTEDLVVDSLVEALRAGEDVPADLGRRLAEIRHDREAAYGLETALTAARQRLEAELRDTLRCGADAGLRVLDGLLHRLLGEVRALPLEGVATAAEAVRAGPDTAAAWRRLDELTREHAELRAAQHDLLGAAAVPVAVIEVAGVMANLDAVWPQWLDWQRLRATTATATTMLTTVVTPAPWPHIRTDPMRPDHGDPAFVLWSATNGEARAWVPAPGQATACAAAARAAATARRDAAEAATHADAAAEAEYRRRAANLANSVRRT